MPEEHPTGSVFPTAPRWAVIKSRHSLVTRNSARCSDLVLFSTGHREMVGHLDLMVLKIFSNFSDLRILCQCTDALFGVAEEPQNSWLSLKLPEMGAPVHYQVLETSSFPTELQLFQTFHQLPFSVASRSRLPFIIFSIISFPFTLD